MNKNFYSRFLALTIPILSVSKDVLNSSLIFSPGLVEKMRQVEQGKRESVYIKINTELTQK